MTELDKWKAILSQMKELTGAEVSAEITAVEAKIAALEAEVETEILTGVAVMKSAFDWHNTLNTLGITVVLLKLFGVI